MSVHVLGAAFGLALAIAKGDAPVAAAELEESIASAKGQKARPRPRPRVVLWLSCLVSRREPLWPCWRLAAATAAPRLTVSPHELRLSRRFRTTAGSAD